MKEYLKPILEEELIEVEEICVTSNGDTPGTDSDSGVPGVGVGDKDFK